MAWTSPKTWASAVLSSTELNTHLRDNLLHVCSTTGNLTITTAGPHAIGSAVLTNVGLLYAATFTPSGAVANAGLAVGPTINAEANQDTYVLDVAGTIVEAGSGTHSLFSAMRIRPPTITAGAATLSNAVTMLINGVPAAGTFTAALFIDALGDDGVHIAMADGTDVNHGITSSYPTSVYGAFRKASATAGGLSINGLSETEQGVQINGHATTEITTEAGSSRGNVNIIALLKSGTSVTSHQADANTVVFLNGVNATHIFKGNGDSYEDGTGWTAYDDHDDVALIEAAEYEVTAAQGNPIKQQFSMWIDDKRALLERLRLMTFSPDGRVYRNNGGFIALLCGATRQSWRRILGIESKVSDLEMRLAALEQKS